MLATDDPDTVFRDGKDHVYDRWGKSKGGHAERKVAAYYKRAVASLAAGNVTAASRELGLLSHYYADVNNPLNTDNAAAERRLHSRYDAAVEARLNAVGKNRAWVRYDGYEHVSDPSWATVSSARSAHASYKSLLAKYKRRRLHLVGQRDLGPLDQPRDQRPGRHHREHPGRRRACRQLA